MQRFVNAAIPWATCRQHAGALHVRKKWEWNSIHLCSRNAVALIKTKSLSVFPLHLHWEGESEESLLVNYWWTLAFRTALCTADYPSVIPILFSIPMPCFANVQKCDGFLRLTYRHVPFCEHTIKGARRIIHVFELPNASYSRNKGLFPLGY